MRRAPIMTAPPWRPGQRIPRKQLPSGTLQDFFSPQPATTGDLIHPQPCRPPTHSPTLPTTDRMSMQDIEITTFLAENPNLGTSLDPLTPQPPPLNYFQACHVLVKYAERYPFWPSHFRDASHLYQFAIRALTARSEHVHQFSLVTKLVNRVAAVRELIPKVIEAGKAYGITCPMTEEAWETFCREIGGFRALEGEVEAMKGMTGWEFVNMARVGEGWEGRLEACRRGVVGAVEGLERAIRGDLKAVDGWAGGDGVDGDLGGLFEVDWSFAREL